MTLAPPRYMLIGNLVVAAALFALFPAFPVVAIWFALRFLSGCNITVVFVISESWINQVVTPARRAFMLGVYGTALAGGFGVGGFCSRCSIRPATCPSTSLPPSSFWAPCPWPCCAAPRPWRPTATARRSRRCWRAARSAPAAILAGLAFGALETLLFSLLPVYGERIDLTHATIGMMVFAVAMGALSFQIPLGWIADRTDRRATLFWIAVTTTFVTRGDRAGGRLHTGPPAPSLHPGRRRQRALLGRPLPPGRTLLPAAPWRPPMPASSLPTGWAVSPARRLPAAPWTTIGPWGLLWTLSAVSAAYVLVFGFRRLTAQTD